MLAPDIKRVFGMEIDRQNALRQPEQPPFFKGGFKEGDAPQLRGAHSDEGPLPVFSQAFAPESVSVAAATESLTTPQGDEESVVENETLRTGEGEGTDGLGSSMERSAVEDKGLYSADMQEDVQETVARRYVMLDVPTRRTNGLADLQQQAELQRFAADSEEQMKPLDFSAVGWLQPATQPIRWLANATIVPLQKRASDALLDAFDALSTQPEILVWHLQAGDHLRVKGVAGFMAMTHHAIYLGDGRIMHFTGGVTDKVHVQHTPLGLGRAASRGASVPEPPRATRSQQESRTVPQKPLFPTFSWVEPVHTLF